jgi:hypothetical protein
MIKHVRLLAAAAAVPLMLLSPAAVSASTVSAGTVSAGTVSASTVSASTVSASTGRASAHASHARVRADTWSSPVINQGGVVNGTDYSADDIHPGTVVAIFGEWFLPPDTVVVTQGSSQYFISAGSPWWYDSGGQINATLPSSLQPGQATVMIVTSAGAQSNTVTITINP